MRRLFFFALAIALPGLTSCGSTPTSTAVSCTSTASTSSTTTSTSTCTDPTTGISVTISPATDSVNVVTTAQFTATVSGGTNTVVTWKVNGITSGNDTIGRIDSNGLYHSPSQVPSPATVNVTAVSFQDNNVSATSAVTIVPPPIVAFTSPASAVPPTSAVTVTSGTQNTVAFSATETGGTTNIILWEVGPVGGLGIEGGNPTLGTITANGVYTPPVTPPIGSTAIVTAVAQDYPNSTASVTVTISGYSTSSLQGQFGFTVAGQSASGAFFRAGSFNSDGAGNLNGGLEDINDASGVTPSFSFAGSYTVTADGRGTLTFFDGHGPGPSNNSTFRFVLVNGNQLQIIGSDSTGTSSGQANLQDTSKFVAGLSGTYVFDFTGVEGASPLSEIGEFTVDGSGGIKSGLMDVNDGGIISSQVPITGGTYTVPVNSNGQGTAMLVTSSTTFHFSFYMVSQGLAKFVGTDTTTQVAGAISQQSPNVAFGPASLDGNYALLLAGSSASASYAAAGSFSADGINDILSGEFDENTGGTPNTNVLINGSSYTVASNGRGTLTFTGGRTYVFYFGAAESAVFQETDSIRPGAAIDGIFTLQQSAPFTPASIEGNYAIASSGSSGPSGQDITGELDANGAGMVPSGMIDINTAGTLTSEPVAAGSSDTGPASNGRATLTVNPSTDNRNFAVYVVNSTLVFIVGIDSNRLSAGALFRQF